jgi:ERCC4-type nuclease
MWLTSPRATATAISLIKGREGVTRVANETLWAKKKAQTCSVIKTTLLSTVLNIKCKASSQLCGTASSDLGAGIKYFSGFMVFTSLSHRCPEL